MVYRGKKTDKVRNKKKVMIEEDIQLTLCPETAEVLSNILKQHIHEYVPYSNEYAISMSLSIQIDINLLRMKDKKISSR